VSGRGYAYGGETWLEHELRNMLADYDRMLPGRLLYYHTRRSDHSPAGFPDWIFAGPGGVLPVELKGATQKLSPAQSAWFAMLAKARVLHPPELWRPDAYREGYVSAKLRHIAGLGIAGRDRKGMPDARDTPATDQD
jgi:hypothetical protein